MSIDSIIDGIYNSKIEEVILIGDSTILLDYEHFFFFITKEPFMTKPLGLSMGAQTSGCWLPYNNQHRVVVNSSG